MANVMISFKLQTTHVGLCRTYKVCVHCVLPVYLSYPAARHALQIKGKGKMKESHLQENDLMSTETYLPPVLLMGDYNL